MAQPSSVLPSAGVNGIELHDSPADSAVFALTLPPAGGMSDVRILVVVTLTIKRSPISGGRSNVMLKRVRGAPAGISCSRLRPGAAWATTWHANRSRIADFRIPLYRPRPSIAIWISAGRPTAPTLVPLPPPTLPGDARASSVDGLDIPGTASLIPPSNIRL